MLPEKFDDDWCTFEAGPYDVYIYTKQIYQSEPSWTRLAKVYAGGKLVYTTDEYTPSYSMETIKILSCHSFGLPVEPIGCWYQGVHVSFPDGSHLEAMPKNWIVSTPAYTWTPSGPWKMNQRYYSCPT